MSVSVSNPLKNEKVKSVRIIRVIRNAGKVFTRLFSSGDESGESRKREILQRKISYRFQDASLLTRALTHRSYFHEENECLFTNERLEFLGDAILGMVVTEELYRRYPSRSEGELTRAKSVLVSRERLAERAKSIHLGDCILLGSGEERSGGRKRSSILADAYEALLGALYLDGGLRQVRRFIKFNLLQKVDALLGRKFHNNFKSWLLEYLQSRSEEGPQYIVLREAGPDHRKEFTVVVKAGKRILGQGKGYSKKQAEQQAARRALESMGLEL